jgi:ERO1-like protein alpha
VNTQLSELYIDFESDRKKMVPNWRMYFEKVGDYPDRIKNLHFYYSVLLRAINKASDVIRHYNFTTGDTESDLKAQRLVNQILDITTIECDHPF